MDIGQLLTLGKKHIIAIGGIAALASGIVGGFTAVETRYAKAADLNEFRAVQKQQTDDLAKRQQAAISNLRLQQLEDKIFELELIERRTPAQQAILQRLYRQREDIKLIQ